jgi:hypothetical protein
LGISNSVADTDQVPFGLLDPRSGMGKKIEIRIRDEQPDHISEFLETLFWVKILKFFYTDPG